MGADDRARWDDIYRRRALEPYPVPDALLVAYTPPAGPDEPVQCALDIACGMGQNALWLAEQGYTVTALDISMVALQRAQAEMMMRNLRGVNFAVVDLERLALEPEQYDVICCFRYLDRALFPAFAAALRPGGLVIIQAFNVGRRAAMPDTNPAYMLEPDEMPAHFPGWEVLHHEELEEFTRFVASKPPYRG